MTSPEREVHLVLDHIVAQVPSWFAQANCRGQGIRFHARDHEGQKRVCARCTVTAECLDWLFERVDLYGQREMVDGDTVCGGLTPREQRVELKRRKESGEVVYVPART